MKAMRTWTPHADCGTLRRPSVKEETLEHGRFHNEDIRQGSLFEQFAGPAATRESVSSTFVDNMRLPVHRWMRYSAGFSAIWAERTIRGSAERRGQVVVLDPFAGSGTTLIAAEKVGVESIGVDAHPFVARIAHAKLSYRSDPNRYVTFMRAARAAAIVARPQIDRYPDLVRRCYTDPVLSQLDQLRVALQGLADGSPQAELGWLTLVSILRKVSHVGTAQWQYVLPKKGKKRPQDPLVAFDEHVRMIYEDMVLLRGLSGPHAVYIEGDARDCSGVAAGSVNLVVTSPPYPNNFDYADATRLEMSFFGEISNWSDLHERVRKYLVRSCSQHVPEKAVNLDETLARPELAAIRARLRDVCEELGRVRLSHGGKKTYHLMVATYFADLARVWIALRRVCSSPCDVCFVLGDSAPYGVYVPVIDWLGQLALAAGFKDFHFERTRDRNVKWKNRKHRVPLCEGRLWVSG